MSLITLAAVGKHFGAEEILDDVTFRLERGDHIALIGANGAGKSTLLRIIAGVEEPDSGAVSFAHSVRVAYLPQEPRFDEHQTLYEIILEVFAESIAAQERLRALEHEMGSGQANDDHIEEYGRQQATVEHTGYDYRERIERVLIGLGLEREHWYAPVETLSGGQRTRANLARTLLQEADVLLLDEPTNHLDIAAVEWLESYLRDLPRAFLIVAHDRYLLDRVTRRTLELSFRRVTEYDAPYSRYLELKTERQERNLLEYEAQQRHITKTEDFIRRYGAGQRSKEARGRQKRLDRLDRVERPQIEDNVHLALNKAQRSGDIVLETHDLQAGYPENPLVRLPARLVLRRGDRVALIGPNGAGKTTLLRTLMGSLPALHGGSRWGARTSVGYYSQTLGQLDTRRTILQEIQTVRPMSEEEARGFMGRFLFSGDDVFKSIGVLSGGEKSRVALARLILEEPNVLVLDEPTNHLDIASRDALQAVLAGFKGTLLFVSHDRYLIDALTEELWVIEDGALTRYAGNYSAYASGRAKLLDAKLDTVQRPGDPGGPETRVRRLEAEAAALAARLTAAGATTTVGNLAEMSDRYTQVMTDLQEAQAQWVDLVRAQLRSFSDSRDRSAAAKPL
ncbi:MAG: ABC-F family ATP-binding cassette domain-containing protein [Chloroflexota bacterium]